MALWGALPSAGRLARAAALIASACIQATAEPQAAPRLEPASGHASAPQQQNSPTPSEAPAGRHGSLPEPVSAPEPPCAAEGTARVPAHGSLQRAHSCTGERAPAAGARGGGLGVDTNPVPQEHPRQMDRWVGGRAPAAGEYHSRDFEWEEVRRDAEAALAAEQALLPGAPGMS